MSETTKKETPEQESKMVINEVQPFDLSKPPLKLLKKMIEARKKLSWIAKDKKNTTQNYDYTSEAAVKAKVKEALDDQGVLFYVPNVKRTAVKQYQTKKGATMIMTSIELMYMFIDSESGEVIHGRIEGEGLDTGDKGLWKAYSGTIKYIFFNNFMIPTGNDPEACPNGEAVHTQSNPTKQVNNNQTSNQNGNQNNYKPTKEKVATCGCGAGITEAVYKHSMSKLGKPLCFNCQQANKGNQQGGHTNPPNPEF